MNTAILKTATLRKIGIRRFDGLYLLHDQGNVTGEIRRERGAAELFFWWNFHEHHGGRGGLIGRRHRVEIKERCGNLVRHQIAAAERARGV